MPAHQAWLATGASAGGPTASSALEDDDDAEYAESDFEEDYDSADEGTDDYDGSDVEADYGIEEDEMEELAEDELDGSTDREDEDDDFVEPAAGRSEEEGERREGSGADDEHTGALGDAIEGSAEAHDWLDSRRMRTQHDHLKPMKLGMVVLPDALKKRIGATLKKVGRTGLRRTAGLLSERLRERTRLVPGQPKSVMPDPVVYRREEAMAYAAHRLPGVYACTFRVMNEIKLRRPEWTPKSLMDFGSGPGTAVWSATEVWPELDNILAVEPSEAMIDVANELCKGKPVKWKRLLPTDPNERYDVVIASYVLSELPSEEERLAKINALWKHTRRGGIMILVEPGTPVGFHNIKLARSTVLGDLSHGLPNVLAPCPHAEVCPMGEDSWCHFTQRMQRIPVQTQSKQNTSINWEDEKFSYVVLTKGNLLVDKNEAFDRLLISPQKRGRHVIMKTCGQDGEITTRIIAKSDGAIYKEARKAAWGDGFGFPDETSKRDLAGKFRPKAFKYRSLSKVGSVAPATRGRRPPKPAADADAKEDSQVM